jgi:DNA-binding CsgD family transcriptional regulator
VAQRLGISVSTVRNHLKSIYRKVGVTSQVSLVRKLLM